MLDSTFGATPDLGTIPRMVRASAVRFGSADALVDGDRRWSFSAVEEQMLAVARSFIASGVEPGDRIAVWAPNSVDWVILATGAHAAGAWLVPLNTRLKGDEAAYILAKTDARMLFAADGFLDSDYSGSVTAVDPGLRALRGLVRMPPPTGTTEKGDDWKAFLARGDTIDSSAVDSRIAAASPNDVSDIIFTSGTTGAPKGVMLRHGASLRGYRIFADRFGLDEGDRYVIPTPFFHCFGYKAGWMASLMAGSVAFPVPVFDAEAMLELIQRERITHVPGPPTMFVGMLDHPRRSAFDLSSLQHAMIGAASIPAVLVDRVREHLGVNAILSAYGLTENHGLATLTEPDDPADIVSTTVGRPLPDIEVRIVDDDGNDVTPGDDGDLLLRGPFLMSGYFDDEEATAAAIVDGWLHTGDVGHFDGDGYLHITDRKKDLFIVGGFNVAPAEVEKALLGMGGVAQVAVVGMPDAYFGEVGAAFVVPQEAIDLTADAVSAYAREHLANYKVPRRVEIVSTLPLNATGKVRKDELRLRIVESTT